MTVQVTQDIMDQIVSLRDNAENNRVSQAAQAVDSALNETYWEGKRDQYNLILADLEVA